MDFLEEYPITTEALKADLVIKKNKGAVIDNPMASIFKGHNIFEYRGPDDKNLSVNDFYMTYAYALLYKVKNEADIDDITISFVVSEHPAEVFAYLKEVRKFKVTEKWDGIYIIEGDSILMQIIDISRLNEKNNLFLSGFNTGVNAQKLERIINKALNHPNLDTDVYLETIIRANPESVQELLKKGNPDLERLLKKLDLGGI